MQNNWKQILSELAPQFFIFLIIVFVLVLASSRIRKNNAKSLDDLRKKDSDKFEKITKFNAYLKLFLWAAFGLFWIGGGIYNSMLFPDGNKLPALFMGCSGVGLVGFGIWSSLKK